MTGREADPDVLDSDDVYDDDGVKDMALIDRMSKYLKRQGSVSGIDKKKYGNYKRYL